MVSVEAVVEKRTWSAKAEDGSSVSKRLGVHERAHGDEHKGEIRDPLLLAPPSARPTTPHLAPSGPIRALLHQGAENHQRGGRHVRRCRVVIAPDALAAKALGQASVARAVTVFKVEEEHLGRDDAEGDKGRADACSIGEVQ